MASPKIQIKRGTTFPISNSFSAGELALNTGSSALYAAISAADVAASSVILSSGVFTLAVTAVSGGYTGAITTTGTFNAISKGSVIAITATGGSVASLANCSVVSTADVASGGTTLNIFITGGTPVAGIVTTITAASGLKWVGAEIEDSPVTFGSRSKLATQGAIKDYVNTVGASGVTIVDAADNNADYYPTFVTGTTTQSLKIDNTSNLLKYNPSTGVLTSVTFSGALSGNSSGTHTGSVTMSGTQTLDTTGGSVSLSPAGIAAPVVNINPSGSASGAVIINPSASGSNGIGTVTISPTGNGTGKGTVTIAPTGLLTLGAAGVATTLSGNLSAAETNQTVALSPTGTGTVTISPASTLTLGKVGVGTTLLGNLSAAETNQTVALSPTGTGTVTISPASTLTLGKVGVGTTLLGNLSAAQLNQTVALSPTGTGTVTINPTAASTINNCSIGATTALAGRFTDLTTTGTTTLNGNFTVNGTQTYLNTTVMTVTDKNIELGFGTGTTGSTFSSGALTTVPGFGTFTAKLSQALGTLWKLTFTSGTIPVGVRVGTTLAQATITAGSAGYIGSTATVVSVTPTEIYYTASGANAPVATSGASTFSDSSGNLTVTNEFTGNVTVGGTDTKNMVVGSAITVTGGTALNTPAVAQILSATQLTIVVRASITVSALTTFTTGSASDITADGGGITLKSTTNSVNTDKTLSWVSSTKNWTFNQGLEVSAVNTKPGLTVNTFDSTGVAMSGLVLSNYNTSGVSVELSPAIEFKSGTTASTSTTGYLLVTNGSQFEFHTAARGTKAFTVSSTGQVGDCTIDCGQY